VVPSLDDTSSGLCLPLIFSGPPDSSRYSPPHAANAAMTIAPTCFPRADFRPGIVDLKLPSMIRLPHDIDGGRFLRRQLRFFDRDRDHAGRVELALVDAHGLGGHIGQ
jgi:hypothetical protein